MREQIVKMRELMKREGIDVYYVTMDDDHQSEYVGDHYREIAELTGFTGSAGKLVITMEEAGLWTDGRYFVQAGKQLQNSGVTLMKMGEPETPAMEDYILSHMPEGGTFGFNGRCVACSEAEELLWKLSRKEAHVVWNRDLPDEIWENRPAPAAAPCWILSEQYAGKPAAEKLSDLRKSLAELSAEAHVISSLDDIAWLLNLRGNDVPCNPVFLSFLLLQGDRTVLYTAKGHLTEEVSAYLAGLSVEVETDTDRVYEAMEGLSAKTLLLEKEKTNYALCAAVPAEVRILDRMLPTTIAKAHKNPVEMENLKKAHIKDGVALTKFIYWFRQNVGKTPLTEWKTVEKLHELRAMQEGFIEESFTTIAAYGPNAAMCHYAPSPEQDTPIEARGLYLVDSGGQYLEGTTDVTRTWACGPCTEEEKRDFTLSVIANLRLADARFLEGTNGVALDYIAREPFWRRGLNFNHGTGHGVGFLLNVHERPVGIRYKLVPERQDSYPFSEGMFVSDEPGLYIEGSHGVRTENLLMCVKDHRNEYGQFCRFEAYTKCPMDKEALDPSYMRKEDVALLNAYHKEVYDALEAYMTEEERAWLKEACAPLPETDGANA